MGKRRRPEEIIAKLRQVEVVTGQGRPQRKTTSPPKRHPTAARLVLVDRRHHPTRSELVPEPPQMVRSGC
jgi:hypothetical protein